MLLEYIWPTSPTSVVPGVGRETRNSCCLCWELPCRAAAVLNVTGSFHQALFSPG